MKILAIRGKNLASLAGEFAVELDEDPLASAGVFAITGPTGAGKSTLLDALCAALFARTPRLSDRGGVAVGRAEEDERDRLLANDVRTLLRRGTGAGFAEVEFVGVDGRRYRSRWSVWRARQRSDGRFQPQAMELEDVEAGRVLSDKKSEVLAAIEDRLGLGFEQFSRSALLAQNDFAAFLRAGAQARAELLERMTGTEIYGWVSMAAHQRAQDEVRALAEVMRSADQLTVLDDDAREALEKEHEAARAALATAKAAADAATRAGAAHERAVAELGRARQGLVESERAEAAARAEVAAAEAAVAAAEAATGPASADAIETLSAADGIASWERGARLAARAARSLDQRRVLADGRPALLEAAEASRAALASARAAHARAVSAYEDAEHRGRAAERKASATPVAAAAARLRRARDIRDLLHRLCAAAERARTARAVVTTQEARAAAAETTAGEAAAEADVQMAERTRLDERRAEARRALDQMNLAVSLSSHRAELADGEACPLCGATEHPWADGEHAIDEALIAQRRRVEALAEAIDRVERRRAEASARAEATRAARREALELARDAEASAERAAEAWRRGLGELGELALFGDPGAPQAGQWIAGRVDAAESELEQLRADEAAAEALRREADELHGATETRRLERDAARDAVLAAERGVHRADEAIAACDRDTDRLAAEARRTVEALAAAAGERLHRAREVAEASAARVTAATAAAAEARTAVAEAARAVAIAADLDVGDAAKDEAEALAAAAAEAIATRERAHAAATEAYSELVGRLRVDDEARRHRAELGARLEEQRERAALYQSLRELIGSADGKRFRVFAQSLTLDALLAHANEHLRELAGRYRLVRVPGYDLDLQVVDRDMGDEVRSVNSLSGGESFLVSLSLALGLSSLSSRDVRVESLLIDEGFGTLDPATLEVALSVLDAVQAGGRKVGLISHVPGLAERVGVRVQVEPRGGGRSAVHVVG